MSAACALRSTCYFAVSWLTSLGQFGHLAVYWSSVACYNITGNHPSDRAAARSDPPAVPSGTAPKSDPAGALRSTTSDNEKSSTGSSSSDGDGGGGVTSGLRHHRREDTRRRRNERRATPYGGVGAVGGGRRGRGVAPSSAVGTRSRRAGPTTGETQVMMSLWGL